MQDPSSRLDRLQGEVRPLEEEQVFLVLLLLATLVFLLLAAPVVILPSNHSVEMQRETRDEVTSRKRWISDNADDADDEFEEQAPSSKRQTCGH